MNIKVTAIDEKDMVNIEIRLSDILSSTKSSKGCFIELEGRKTSLQISESSYLEILEKSLLN